MVGLDPDYWFYDDYREAELDPLSTIETLSVLDSEIMHAALLSRYQGPVDRNEWSDLEAHYNGLYRDLIEQRLRSSGLPVTPAETVSESQFHDFQ